MSFTPEKKVGSIPCFRLYLTFSYYLDRVLETASDSNFRATVLLSDFIFSLNSSVQAFLPII